MLVVEDDEVNQVLATSQLARLGLAALVVGSGRRPSICWRTETGRTWC